MRPGASHTANNCLVFLESTLENLGTIKVGLFRADSGFYDKAVVNWLRSKSMNYILSAKLTRTLQQAMIDQCAWQSVADGGIQVSELEYQPKDWDEPVRFVVVRQHIKRANAAGKTLALFESDPDLQGWRYGAMVTDMSLPALEIWRLYRGRADCENRIKELKADFGLDSFVLREFCATEAALSIAMLAYNLMGVFRHAVLGQKVHNTLATLHHKVLAVGAYWDKPAPNQDQKPVLRLAMTRKRRPWFEGLWANAGEPVALKMTPAKS